MTSIRLGHFEEAHQESLSQTPAEETMVPKPKLPGLDAMRFYAAAMIVLFHLVHLTKLEIPLYLHFIRTQFGIGVPFFYMVSAFSLMVGYFGRLENKEQLKDFYLRRFWRIAPLFYFIIIVSLLIQYFFYNIEHPFSEVLASVFFVFNIIPNYVTGFVWASWSIGVEMIFYLVFPVLLVFVGGILRAIYFWVIAIYVGIFWISAFSDVTPAIKAFRDQSIFAHFHYFAVGLVSYFIYESIRCKTKPALSQNIGFWLGQIGILLLVVMMFWPITIIQYTGVSIYPVLRGIPLALMIIGVSLYSTPFLVGKSIVAIGKTSFSMYLLHPIVIFGLQAAGIYKYVSTAVVDKGLAFLICAIITFSVLIPLANLSYRLIERPGMRMVDVPLTLRGLVETFFNNLLAEIRRAKGN